jgi:hypothetical protein
MTGIDLTVLAPWIVFGVGLAIVCILLLRSHRASTPQARRSSPTSSGQTETPFRPDRASAGQDAISRPSTQENRCLRKN